MEDCTENDGHLGEPQSHHSLAERGRARNMQSQPIFPGHRGRGGARVVDEGDEFQRWKNRGCDTAIDQGRGHHVFLRWVKQRNLTGGRNFRSTGL